MKRSLLLLALAACKTVATDGRTAAVPDAAVAKAIVAEDAAPAAEAPLAWATRPAAEGPLFPVVDGTCMRGEVWPVGASALFTMGRSTMGRLDDEGLVTSAEVTAASDPKHPFERPTVQRVVGTWPAPLVLHGYERGLGRTRGFDSTWYREPNGWALLGSYREKGEPSYAEPILHKGWIVTARAAPLGGGGLDTDWSAHLMVAYPSEKGATPIPGLNQLARAKLSISRFAASDTTLYAFAWSQESHVSVIRFLKDGKVGEVAGEGKPFGTTSSALFTFEEDRVSRLEDGKMTRLPYKPPAGATILAASLAPDGDVWLLTSKRKVVVLHGKEATETALPAPAKPGPAENVVYSPSSGAALAGVDIGDPYAIGEGGAVFHLTGGTWTEVPFPAPPFATTGRYRAQALHVPAKGDVYVNAGYVEKGLGWSSSTGYRAILRTKRPREVLRCNEPRDEINGISDGVMSFPPLAGETCKTPFVILLRIGWDGDRVFTGDTDYASVRAAIKATPSLGATVDLVEVVSGNQRFLGAKVPSLAAGQELARAAAKAIKIEFHTTKPEVVCGTPKEERVLHVDVATGKVK